LAVINGDNFSNSTVITYEYLDVFGSKKALMPSTCVITVASWLP